MSADDIEECALVYPQLSSVRRDIARFARCSATVTLEWLESGRQPPNLNRAPVKLLVLQSSLGAALSA